jgi:Ser/Thr protein kinase RdoA (MazF antagonist)
MTFVKEYREPFRCQASLRHYRWLARIAADIRMPAVVAVAPRRLTFEAIAGANATTSDLEACAVVLGQLSAATSATLRGAPLDQAHEIDSSWAITDFWTPRVANLSLRVQELLTLEIADSSTSVYKDANLRNFIIGPDGVTIVDFDDLTLAPHGYDFAKLLISTAMTEGTVPENRIDAALAAFNASTAQPCSPRQLAIWCEVNWLLTAHYVGHHYRYSWPALRPWPNPIAAECS